MPNVDMWRMDLMRKLGFLSSNQEELNFVIDKLMLLS